MESNPSTNFVKGLRENWFVIVFIGSLIIGWNTFSNRLKSVEAAQTEQRGDIKDLTTQQASTIGAIIEIKANYIFIKSALDEIRIKK